MSRAGVEAGVSLEVPSFFDPDETTEALQMFSDVLNTDVWDSGLRRELSSADATEAIQLAVYIVGNLALGVLGNAGWAALTSAYRRLRERYSGRPVSIELVAEDDDGNVADYSFSDGSDEALRAIPADLKRGMPGTRVRYEVDEGWLTSEESQDKKYRKGE